MRRGTKVLLLAGCAVVLLLELPASLPCLVAGWRGPYAEPNHSPLVLAGPAAALPALPPGWVGCIGLARR